MGEKILVVDDELDLTMLLQRILVREGYQVQTAEDGTAGLRLAYSFQPDLILLDVMMPEMDGWTMLRRLREFCDVPVIFLTAVGGLEPTIDGLDLGADDYITKPFARAELVARVQAVLRRRMLPPASSGEALRFDGGNLVIDPSIYSVSVRGQDVSLTPTEYELLLYLALNAGRVLTYEDILVQVWGEEYEGSDSNVKVYVRRLRHKIEENPSEPRYILNHWGVGYSLARI
jgi:two-component system response regulator VicR